MSFSEHMMGVLSQKSELTPKNYDFLLESQSQNPRFLSYLVKEGRKDRLIDLFTCRSDRFTCFFQRIYAAPPSIIPPGLRYILSEQIITLLIELLPELYNALEDNMIIELLTPVLALSLEQKPSNLPKLATMLSTRTLQTLFAEKSSGTIMQEWAAKTSNLMPRDPVTLEVWTRILVCMAENCAPDHHGANHEIHLFKTLAHLKDGLLDHDRNLDIRTSLTQHHLPQLERMTALGKYDKKSNRTKHNDTEVHFPELPEDLQAALGSLHLEIPHSSRKLQHVVDLLKIEKTLDVLKAIAGTFPCSRCKKALIMRSLPSELPEDISKDSLSIGDLNLEVLGKSLGTWKVLLSQAALKTLQSLNQLEAVEPKLKDLSLMCAKKKRTGTKEQRNHLRIPLFETTCGKDLSILWQLDVGATGDAGVLQQEIKIWKIGNRCEISKAIDHVIILHKNYSEETAHQCCQHPQKPNGKDLLPLRFNMPDHNQDSSLKPSPSLDVRLVGQETIDMANKFYALTEPVLRSILANDLSAQFPFDLSDEEAKIIKHFDTSNLILGRSGTGKTTCLVFKLVAKFLASKALDDQPIHQILITRSGHLAKKLRIYTNQLIHTLDMRTMVKNLPDKNEDAPHPQSEDGNVNESALTLDDRSFPLICTFDRLLRLLENTVKAMDRHHFEDLGETVAPEVERGAWVVVGYTSFRLDYWPRFPQSLTKNLPEALVFSEIMGVIKGSVSSRATLKHLTREEYLTRSKRLAPTFADKERPLVYKVFEIYEGMKLQRGELDYIDRVVNVLREIRKNPHLKKLLSAQFQEIYIDEVQDQRTMDIELFLGFIDDSRGFHFAGDTAQAIAQDSTFRFEDISALIYNHFAPTSAAANQAQMAKPTMFKLAKNYRSHQGILRLASLVMNLLWKGFADTVDKLGPEIGQLHGPKPTVFLGCGADLLTSTNVGLINLSEHTADFGAEQVILVRDEVMKVELQNQIGDAALILTILQSKGMEFDDVILWDFFSRCPNATGIRNLSALLSVDTAGPYARKHSDMCAELKRLYVAVTRARIQLFLIESSVKVMQSVTDLLQGDSMEPIIDITSPADHHFEAKFRSLRPGHSVDPRRWSLRGEQFMQAANFKDALFCFRKAQDTRGVMRAQAKVHSEDGRTCKASGNVSGSILAFDLARQLFMELNSVADAAAMLEAMDRIGDAARLWRTQGDFGRAAHLFSRAQLWVDAANSYECNGRYTEAATALRHGNNFDELVLFLSKSREKMEPHAYARFTRLCKLLLKQGKISPISRKNAVNLLGSLAEQESCFREYDMHAELSELYILQHRYADAYSLHIRKGHLPKALQTALRYKLAFGSSGIAESQVLHLMDYVLTGQAVASLKKQNGQKFEVPRVDDELLTRKMAVRLGQWKIASQILPWTFTPASQHVFDSLEEDDMKAIVSLLNIGQSFSIAACSELAELPYSLLHEAIKVINGVVLKDNHEAKLTMMLVNGLRSTIIPGEDENPLPWSPFADTGAETTEVACLATSSALLKLSNAISAFDSKARDLWKARTPYRCLEFLTRGSCRAHQRGDCDLRRSHKTIMLTDCIQNMADLHKVIHVICGMTGLYYRHVMPEIFRKTFLGMKRRWLESLIRQLTYVSALEQDFATVAAGRLNIVKRNLPPATVASIEDLLFVRIRAEWNRRGLYSAILEDLQVAELLGNNFKSRFHCALSYKVASTSDMDRIILPRLLKEAAKKRETHRFEGLLTRFMEVLLNTPTSHMGSLYSIVTELESLAAFLIIAICSSVSLVPYSWLATYASWMVDSNTPTQSLDFSEKVIYTRCLFSLTRGFCGLLDRLEIFPPQGPGIAIYPDLLRQRNAELLALVSVNSVAEKTLPLSFGDTWACVVKTFQTFFASAIDFKFDIKFPLDLHARLQKSFSRYNGKHFLVVLSKALQPNHAFTTFKDARKMTHDELWSLSASQEPTATSPSAVEINAPDQYSAEDNASVIKIQLFWRKWYQEFRSKYRRHQEYLKSAEGQLAARYIKMGFNPSIKFYLRAKLVSEALGLHLRLNSARALFSPLRKGIMSKIENIEDSDDQYEALDDCVHQCSTLEKDLEKASGLMLERNLKNLVANGLASELDGTLAEVGRILEAVEISVGCVQKLSM